MRWAETAFTHLVEKDESLEVERLKVKSLEVEGLKVESLKAEMGETSWTRRSRGGLSNL